MSLSNLIRGDAVAIDAGRLAGAGAPPPPPKRPPSIITRIVRNGEVGMQRPISLAPPARRPAAGASGPEADPAEDPLGEQRVSPTIQAIREAARVQGYNVGFEQGQAAAMAAAEEQMAPHVRRLAELVSSIHESHATFFRAAERQVVDLALQIAQKVVEREIENIPDLAVHVVHAALEEMDSRTAVRLRVNPEDVELLRRHWTSVVPHGMPADRVELQPDERVTTGGAVIETAHGQVDAQLESKLAQLSNALWTFVMDVEMEPRNHDADGA
jgi:flagellar biosynthesis/type III secretory pathway protein FliH